MLLHIVINIMADETADNVSRSLGLHRLLRFGLAGWIRVTELPLKIHLCLTFSARLRASHNILNVPKEGDVVHMNEERMLYLASHAEVI